MTQHFLDLTRVFRLICFLALAAVSSSCRRDGAAGLDRQQCCRRTAGSSVLLLDQHLSALSGCPAFCRSAAGAPSLAGAAQPQPHCRPERCRRLRLDGRIPRPGSQQRAGLPVLRTARSRFRSAGNDRAGTGKSLAVLPRIRGKGAWGACCGNSPGSRTRSPATRHNGARPTLATGVHRGHRRAGCLQSLCLFRSPVSALAADPCPQSRAHAVHRQRLPVFLGPHLLPVHGRLAQRFPLARRNHSGHHRGRRSGDRHRADQHQGLLLVQKRDFPEYPGCRQARSLPARARPSASG
jgi:hypothetical protein